MAAGLVDARRGRPGAGRPSCPGPAQALRAWLPASPAVSGRAGSLPGGRGAGAGVAARVAPGGGQRTTRKHRRRRLVTTSGSGGTSRRSPAPAPAEVPGPVGRGRPREGALFARAFNPRHPRPGPAALPRRPQARRRLNWRCSGIAALSVEAILLLSPPARRAGRLAAASAGPARGGTAPAWSRPGCGHPNSACGTPADQPVRATSAD
jgi:hypothetical protein